MAGVPTQVLLVEDNPSDVLLAREVMKGYPDLRVRHVARLADAIRLLVKKRIDVVLLDLGLPDSQGLDTLVALLCASPDVPVVVMTARDDEDLALKAVQAGAQDYLVKNQVVNGVLARAIRYAIERRHAQTVRQERMALAALIADVGLAFTRTGPLQEMLQHCAESMVRNLGGASARIWTLNEADNVLELRASAGMYTHLDGAHSRVPVGQYKIGLIAQEKKPHLTNDVADDSRLSDRDWARREGMVAFAGYPLLLEDRLVGVVGMFARKPLNETAFQAMASVANQIALGVERKQKEEALQITQTRLEHVLSSGPAIIYSLSLVGGAVTSVWISENVKSLLGYHPPDTWNVRWWFENLHPEDRPIAESTFAELLKSGHSVSEYRFRNQSGDYRWVRDEKRLFTDAAGRPVECIGSWTDITNRKQAEAERDALLARLQLYIERMPLAYMLFDADMRIAEWNGAAERIFGFTRDEMLGKGPPYAEIVPRSFWSKGEELRARIRKGEMDAHSINENLTKDGRTITCQWFNTPLMVDGAFNGFLCLAQDLTERITLETQLRQAQKMEAIGSLAGGIAHDFNNLLTIITGYSDIMQMQLTPDNPVSALAREIGQAGGRAASLTRQLLAFSRKQVLEPKALNLNDTVTGTATMLRRLIGEDVELSTALESSLGPVIADAGQIEQVLINLAVNARDAMPRGGKLTIETANTDLGETYTHAFPDLPPGAYVLLAVTDTGTGMDEKTKARIFEPFFTTKEPGKGTGLGLATVFGIVKQSGGHVAVYSELGHGSSFKIYLPRIDEKAAEAEIDSPRPDAETRGTETILLAEDEPAVRALARHVLQMHGYTVLEAGQAEKALRVAQDYQGTIHLLVTDVVMPSLSGRQLAERLAAIRPGMKVLFLSGYTDDAVVRHGVLRAETAFLQKPFTPAALAQKVRETLDRPSAKLRPTSRQAQLNPDEGLPISRRPRSP